MREMADAIIAGQKKAVEEVLDGDVAETVKEFVGVESDESVKASDVKALRTKRMPL